ncbi:hypothetical protein MSAN_02514500 [Mycena sanguinolenta]|uniref:Uncharacterized protein n=1 Tax=Mycena sanguinolenta TaxID=230812 RepID=A0A8H6TYZ2_9AGAR|nr:hypothetical protein MSAN_02514500 [Mycena sanguinolenta]
MTPGIYKVFLNTPWRNTRKLRALATYRLQLSSMSAQLVTPLLSPALAISALHRGGSSRPRLGDRREPSRRPCFGSYDSTFLAAVQSQVMALSYQDTSTCLKIALNVFGFVTSACLGLLLSTLLQQHMAVVQAQINAIDDPSAQLREIVDVLEPTDVRAVLRHSLRDFPELFRRVHAKVKARAALLAK